MVCGNLDAEGARTIRGLGADYIDENDVDLRGRYKAWPAKHREAGWYKQMFLRLSIDRILSSEQAVILDAEVFAFKNWDEDRLYDSTTGHPRSFYWTPARRKPEWDYAMYRGAAKLLSALPEFGDVMAYASSDNYRRHISGVVLFSTRNVAHLWRRLETETDLEKGLDRLFGGEPDLAFSDHDFYGIAVDYGMFDGVVPTAPFPGLLGWYDVHDDPVFHEFRHDAMWSMCQRFREMVNVEKEYLLYMNKTAERLGCSLIMTWDGKPLKCADAPAQMN
jgi:hypothetical protein